MPEKNLGWKKFWRKKCWVKQNLGLKNLGSKKFWVKKEFGALKNFKDKLEEKKISLQLASGYWVHSLVFGVESCDVSRKKSNNYSV